MSNSWRPNWRDPAAYPHELTDHEWRWEFLRRCEDYQADYVYFRSKTREKLARYELPNRGFWERYARAEMPGSMEKYGVDWLEDPAEPRPSPEFFLGRHLYRVGIHALVESSKEQDAEFIFSVPVDLRKPIKTQLDEAKELLLSFQTDHMGKTIREGSHEKKWADYLRLLDAEAAGAENRDIVIALQLEGEIDRDPKNPNGYISDRIKSAKDVQARFKKAP